jgi:hypothetical protein
VSYCPAALLLTIRLVQDVTAQATEIFSDWMIPDLRDNEIPVRKSPDLIADARNVHSRRPSAIRAVSFISYKENGIAAQMGSKNAIDLFPQRALNIPRTSRIS